ncbi:MAG: hypothetical protein WEE66_04735 [Actinomycetota bacterium]
MTERWQKQLRKLRGIEPPADGWQRAESRAPGGDGLPPPRQRVVAGIVAFGVFAAAGAFGWQAFRSGGTPAGPAIDNAWPADPSPESETAPSAASSPMPVVEDYEAFVPSTYEEGGMIVLPITLPDGSTAEITYPPSLDIAGMGARPYWVGCGHDFGFHHYDPYGAQYDGEPLETFVGANGEPVSLWRGAKGTGGIDFLIFHFGPWTVDLYQYRNGVSPQPDREACAQNLRGEVTDDGWLVLDGPPSVALPEDAFGPPEGPEVDFGGLSPRGFIQMWPGPCDNEPDDGTKEIGGVHVDISRDFASWCDPGEMMRIHVYFEPGSELFARVFEDVEVRNVTLAG